MEDRVKFELNGIFFTWDDEKAIKNWQKHRITFQLATEVFFDSYVIDKEDFLHSSEELRRRVIGRTFDLSETLFVVYVERETWDGDDVIRIISARHANREEKKEYDSGISK